MKLHRIAASVLVLVCSALTSATRAQAPPTVTTPLQEFGHNFGDDYFLANYKQLAAYWQKLDRESDRMVLQSIGKTALLLHHVNKGDALNGSSATRQLSAYGSVYWENEVLVAWSMELLRDPGSSRHTVLLHQKKNNDGAYHPDLGLEFDHSGGKLIVRTTDLDNHPELLEKMNLSRQVLSILKTGPMTYAEMAEATGATEGGIRATCYRLGRAGRIVAIPQSDPVKWGLAAMGVST